MEVRVRIPGPLRELVGGETTVVVDVEPVAAGGSSGAPRVTFTAVLDALALEHHALERRVLDELGRPRTHVNLFVGADNVRDLDGLRTPVAPGVEVSILPAISGG